MRDRMEPIWNGGMVYKETVAVIEEQGSCRTPLLFDAERIISVESYDGRMVYEQGKDYVLRDKKLVLTEETRIPYMSWDYLIHDTKEKAQSELDCRSCDIGFGPVATTDSRYITLNAIDNPEYITKYQIAVTYETTEKWEGYRPASEIRKLPHLYQKLQKKEKIEIVLYGDSISCGYDCSGFYGLEPNQPIWAELLVESLREAYGCEIVLHNVSLGGANTDWAIENVTERVGKYQPDLVILGFGMNDRCDGEEYAGKTRQLIQEIRKTCPEAELVLIATTLPNALTATPPIYFCAKQHEYADSLQQLKEEGIVIADVQSVQKEMLKKKRYIDMTGNWLNHPNDYLARVQAQVLNSVLVQ